MVAVATAERRVEFAYERTTKGGRQWSGRGSVEIPLAGSIFHIDVVLNL